MLVQLQYWNTAGARAELPKIGTLRGLTVFRGSNRHATGQRILQPPAVASMFLSSGFGELCHINSQLFVFGRGGGMYRCEARSVEAFVQQIAVSYVLNGYYFFVTGEIPEGKDPRGVDAKIIDRYGLNISKWRRCRRRRAGIAAVQYLRFGRSFVILATEGEHVFFDREAATIRDLRRAPIKCFGYSIGCHLENDGTWHASVRIEDEAFRRLKESFNQAALCLGKEKLAVEIRSLPFAPFAPVRGQFVSILHLVNRLRKRAGLPLVPGGCVRRKRKPVRVFCKTTVKPRERTPKEGTPESVEQHRAVERSAVTFQSRIDELRTGSN